MSNIKCLDKRVKCYPLESKINSFISWYGNNFVDSRYINRFEKKSRENDMRAFVEKMAVWYEFKYTDYDVNDLYHCASNIITNSTKDYLLKNCIVKSVTELLTTEEKEVFEIAISLVSWADLLSFEKFILQDGEAWFLRRLKRKKDYEKAKEINELKEKFLDCVMFRIIERGGNRIGPRRAFLFAKEFKRNIDISMMYGVDSSDPGLRKFAIEYLKAGGRSDLECYENYGSRSRKNETVSIVTVGEIIKCKYKAYDIDHIEDEVFLYQRLVDLLAFKANK